MLLKIEKFNIINYLLNQDNLPIVEKTVNLNL